MRLRVLAGVFACLCAACGGGGGGIAVQGTSIAQFNLALVRADVPTLQSITIGHDLAGDVEVQLLEPPGDGPFVPIEDSLPGMLENGADFTLPVLFTPPGPGDHAGEFTLRFVAVNGSSRQDVVVSLRATVEETTIALDTGVLDFGDVRIGESRNRTLSVRNPNELTPVYITGFSTLPSGFRLAAPPLPATLAAGATLHVQVTYEPTELADSSFAAQVFHDQGPVPLTATVIARTTTWVPEMIVDFGTVQLSGGETEWLEVDVPAHGISLSLEAISADHAIVGLLGLEGPGGKVYENEDATGALLWTPGDGGVFTSTVPNSDQAEVQLVDGGGTYRFRFYVLAGAETPLQVRAIIHNRPGGVVVEGVLPLNVFLAQGLGISAAAAPTETRLQAILEEVDDIFAQQGLRLGEISYFVLDDPAYDRVSGSEFGDLLEETSVAPETRLNLFFVLRTLGGGVVGAAAQVPGPARNGTRVSGVMVDYDFGGVATNGHVTAHEIGHQIGLFHTTESDGSHDLIEDTVECPASGTSSECTTEGHGYLMHWRVVTDDDITNGQARVILGHPLVHPREGTSLTSVALRLPRPPRGELDPLPPDWCGTPACRGK